MCGQFALNPVDYDTRTQVGVDQGSFKLSGSPRIYPTDTIAVIHQQQGRIQCSGLRWGLDTEFLSRPVINARSETVAEKPLFRTALAGFRCLLPMSAWFEWRKEGVSKVGYRFEPQALMNVAGIAWPPSSERPQGAVVMLTTAAEGSVSHYHHRMPLILPAQQAQAWLQAPDVPAASLPDLTISPMDKNQPYQANLF
ncbi:SOS response-associated peptidase [Ferrimonas marina]|uniref:Abasic site processing protein n=1 Tax=Ferrimonas marina TaxID=299255 RepID=A0A1M5YCY2_9GAMM|nr:SOS response-associated peptidase family protein [Ferrimonas marina]SHI09905.1 Putative SOS response-associated peptidase YedK [Ferrimonas marina]